MRAIHDEASYASDFTLGSSFLFFTGPGGFWGGGEVMGDSCSAAGRRCPGGIGAVGWGGDGGGDRGFAGSGGGGCGW